MQAQVQLQESPLRKLLNFFVGLAALGVVGAILLFILSSMGIVGRGNDGPHDWTAITASREAVKARLLSPGSAKFPSSLSQIAARTADGKYLIAYIVADSQNTFGALLRSESLVLLLDRDGEMTVLHVETSQKSPTVQDVRKLTEEVGETWQIEKWLL